MALRLALAVTLPLAFFAMALATGVHLARLYPAACGMVQK